MGKRRRERDRPKAGPEANYNPHKRVHLSYGSDDEVEQDATTLQQPPPINYPAAAKTATPTSRRHSSATSDEAAEHKSAAARSNTPRKSSKSDKSNTKPNTTGKKPTAYPSKNEITNQKPALGSLSYSWEAEDGDSEHASEEDEAMAYLRAVRSERQGIPIVLRASDGTTDEDIYSLGDSRGYIVEDCYIARPVLRPQPPKKKTVTAKEAYTEILKRRFKAARSRFWDPHLTQSVNQTDDSKHIPSPYHSKKAYDECVSLVQNSSPSPTQLQALDQEDTLGMIELIQNNYFKRGETLAKNTCTWIWALLARLDDVGNMNNDEVFVLRDLGKRALVIQISFNNAAMAAQLEDISRAEAASDNEATSPQREGQEKKQDDPSKTDTAGSTVTQKLDPENTLATLDMIVTIVGEFFGQRDLLDSRRSWEPEV
ncbi:hypothetical protein Q7P37_006541 [Cladosporium fusiforme]